MLQSTFNIFVASAFGFLRGWSLTDLGRYQEALQLLGQWVEIIEHNGVYVNLGRYLE